MNSGSENNLDMKLRSRKCDKQNRLLPNISHQDDRVRYKRLISSELNPDVDEN